MNASIKKTLALVLALVMCLGLLAACGNDDGPTKEAATLPSVNTDVKNSDTYPLSSNRTFSVYCGSAKLNEKYVNEFWTGVTGITTDWVNLDAAALKTQLSIRDIPDMFAMCASLTKAQAKEYGDAGVFINFADYLEYMPNVAAMFEKYPEALAVVQNDDGSVYSLPQVGQKVTGFNPLSIRTDMLTAAGWTKAPETTEEFLQCIKDIQAHFGKDDPEFQAFNGYRKSYMDWRGISHGLMAWFFPAFGELLSATFSVTDDYQVVFGASTEQFKNTMKYLNEIYESGAFGTGIYSEDGTTSRALTASNKVACSLYFNTLAPSQFDSGKIELTICEPFTSAYHSEKHIGVGFQFTWYNMMISAECEDIETACRWMDAFYAPQDNPLNEDGTIWGISFSLGEYGKHWTVNEEEKTFTLHEVNGITTGNATNMVNLAPGWYEFNYVQAGDKTGTDVIAQGNLKNVVPYRESMSAYNLDSLNLTEDESDLYADYFTGINNYIAEMSAKFVTGQLDVDASWDEYLRQLDALGVDDIIEMYQGALNRTLNKNK